MVSIPILSARASAGIGIYNGDEEPIDRLPFSRDLLREMGASPRAVHIIHVVGDSMAPLLPEGAMVMIDTDRARQRRDGIYAFRQGEGEAAEARVKRVRFRADGGIDLLSDNKAYDTETYPTLESVSIIGKAIWRGEKL